MSIAPPQKIADRYRLIEPLGQGGMGRVWKARDEVLHRDVAIKELVPPPGLTEDERREMRERSLREARAIARLNHANAVRVFDVLRTDGDPWIVMEYVPSRSLQDTLATEGRLPSARVVEIGLGVLGALRAAHRAGVMHRDVKPGNVLLGEDGRVVLTDFGLATVPGDPNVTRTGLVLGSPAYIAPERAKDGTAGPEGDLWSLGATLYAAVEGASPFARPSAIATLAALATEPIPAAPHAGPLKAVLNGLLQKDPASRVSADVAERLLRRANGRRAARGKSLLDGVRRPGPFGPREPRTDEGGPVPAPRMPERPSDSPVVPAQSAASGNDEKTAKVPAPQAKSSGTAAGAAAAAAVAGAAAAGAAADRKASSTKGAPLDETRVDGQATDTRPGDAPTTAVPGPVFAPGVTRPASGVNPGTRSIDPVSAGGRAAIPPPDDRPASPLARRKGWLIGTLVALLLLGLIVVLPQVIGGDDPKSGTETGGDRSTTAAPGPSASQESLPPSAAPNQPSTSPEQTVQPSSAPGLPVGWRMHRDPTGFSVPVLKGWTISRKDGYVYFRDPDSARWFLVGQTNTPQPDPVADWTKQERDRKGGYANYRGLGIRAVDYWDKAADWEWTYTEDGRNLRTVNRGFITAPNKAYGIRWETEAAEWNANLSNFQIIADNFVPAKR